MITTFTAIVLYGLIWWVVIFCVLPFDIQSIGKNSEGNMTGAPVNPRMKYKLILTTIIALIVWIIVLLIIIYGGISFQAMADKMPR